MGTAVGRDGTLDVLERADKKDEPGGGAQQSKDLYVEAPKDAEHHKRDEGLRKRAGEEQRGDALLAARRGLLLLCRLLLFFLLDPY